MKTIVVVNGEDYWPDYLPEFQVVKRRLQETRWVLRRGELWAVDSTGGVQVDAVLWRLGAVRPHPSHRTALEIIRIAKIPCVNPADVLLKGYDRLSMLQELQQAKLPVNPFDVVIGERMLPHITPRFPAVVKVGNYHGGFGKALVRNEEQWNDIVDLCFVTEDYVTVEPFIDYVRDIRCLAVGNQIWGMSRQGRYWKANQGTTAYASIALPDELIAHTQTAMRHFNADILGLDFLETQDGEYILLESNDIPGLVGFPDEVKTAVAEQIRQKISIER